MPSWLNPTSIGIASGILFGIAHIVQMYIPSNTIAWKIADKVLALGPNVFDLLGSPKSTPGHDDE